MKYTPVRFAISIAYYYPVTLALALLIQRPSPVRDRPGTAAAHDTLTGIPALRAGGSNPSDKPPPPKKQPKKRYEVGSFPAQRAPFYPRRPALLPQPGASPGPGSACMQVSQ